MFNRRITIILGFSIFILIVFDAYQQKYYVDTFNLSTVGFNFFYLLKSHSLRWLVWLIGSIPYVRFARSIFSKRIEDISNRSFLSLLMSIIFSILIIILLISIASAFLFNEQASFTVILEWYRFIFFQKVLGFTLASSLLVLLIYNSSTKKVIHAQWIEINQLKKKANQVPPSQENQSISIKIGNRLKIIPLNEIYWFESDDYCVKIHTKLKSYSLRKSLKSLEKELWDFRFVRVHRKALLNLSFLDQIDFNFGVVRLLDNTELPVSKSGARMLKKAVS
tara:strand:- start:28805 stop:29641 length:837 start_codon:yes stop_codon:yes gene_type:complete